MLRFTSSTASLVPLVFNTQSTNSGLHAWSCSVWVNGRNYSIFFYCIYTSLTAKISPNSNEITNWQLWSHEKHRKGKKNFCKGCCQCYGAYWVMCGLSLLSSLHWLSIRWSLCLVIIPRPANSHALCVRLAHPLVVSTGLELHFSCLNLDTNSGYSHVLVYFPTILLILHIVLQTRALISSISRF